MTCWRKNWLLHVSLASLAIAVTTAATAADSPPTSAPQSTQVGEIVVTATRREETLNHVSESISAFSAKTLQTLQIKSFADLAKFTPGVSFDQDSHDIFIRGIDSTAGSSTTGIYIDDTPIQLRNLGFNSNNALPAVFDLSRVEVLRGPQGTLFGAGSEGGTIRYITNQPSLATYSGMAHAEVAFTQGGAPSYEGGAAVGGPIVEDKLGFRLSAWARRDGGYVDWVNFQTLQPIEAHANWVDTYALRGAITWAVTPKLSITPAIDYQMRDQNQQDEYWVSVSNPSQDSYLNGTPDRMPDNDHFVLPTLRIEWDAGPVKVISDTSYFDRRERVSGYSGTLYNLSYFQHFLNSGSLGYGYPSDPMGVPCANNCQGLDPLLTATGPNVTQDPGLAGYVASNTITNAQQNFTQEIRVVSADAASPVQWTAGVFYSFDRQQSNEQIFDPQLPALSQYLWGEDIVTAWGENLLPGGVDYDNNTRAVDRQEALFADATWSVTSHLRLEVGMRYAWTHFRFVNTSDGPQELSGGPVYASGAESDHPFTPKATVTWQFDRDDMVYATVSKGFRIGGAVPPLPMEACLGTFPDSYASDFVWNYEVGTKDQFLNRTLAVEASAFYISWSNIQQSFAVPACDILFTTNAGSAVSKGFDFQSQWRLTSHLEIDASLGFTDAKFTSTYFNTAISALPLVARGDALDPDTGPWTFTIGAQYGFTLLGRPAFVRVDDTFNSRRGTPIPLEDPRTAFYDPALIPDPAVNQLSAKAGVTIERWDFAIFANNIIDAHPLLNYQHEDSATVLYEAETLRPRTVGISADFRF